MTCWPRSSSDGRWQRWCSATLSTNHGRCDSYEFFFLPFFLVIGHWFLVCFFVTLLGFDVQSCLFMFTFFLFFCVGLFLGMRGGEGFVLAELSMCC